MASLRAEGRRRQVPLPPFQTAKPSSRYALAFIPSCLPPTAKRETTELDRYGRRGGRARAHSLRSRQAMRDCSDHSSMKPGEAVWENRPPGLQKEARLAS